MVHTKITKSMFLAKARRNIVEPLRRGECKKLCLAKAQKIQILPQRREDGENTCITAKDAESAKEYKCVVEALKHGVMARRPPTSPSVSKGIRRTSLGTEDFRCFRYRLPQFL